MRFSPLPPSPMPTLLLPAADPSALARALAALSAGGLVVFPTDTVYGLGARINDAQAIARLYEVKGRSLEKAIPVLLGDRAHLPQAVREMSAMGLRLAERFWPGALTLVAQKQPWLPQQLSAYATIGVRMPAHPAALALLRAAGPLAVTSANLSGGENSVTAAQALAQLEGRVDLVLDGGRAPGGLPSTVVDCTQERPVILRAGPVTLEELEAALR
ncbi:MAG: threonylcarbamoyl-AMP synthase [Chloroflexi bacterium]|nr:threonylcarbamoyl-AMP synthase [Chloroflexota bacterium]